MRVIQENFRRMDDYFGPYGGAAPHLELLSRFLGGQWFEGQVVNTTSTLPADDTEFEHNLNRVPELVILSAPTDGNGGVVIALPAGGQGPIGANVQPWTRTKIFVRSSVTGLFQFIVL